MLAGLDIDTMIGSYLLDATRPPHRIEDLALEHLGYKAIADEELRGRGAKALNYCDLPPDAVVDFCNERSDLAFKLADPLRRQLADKSLDALYLELELPLIPVLAEIERAGIRVETQQLIRMSGELDTELAALQRDISRWPRGIQHKLAEATVQLLLRS